MNIPTVAALAAIVILTGGKPASVAGNASLNRSNLIYGSNPFELRGTITELKNDSVYAYARIEDEKGKIIRIDTFATAAREGRFILKGMIDRPSYAYVYIGKNRSDYFSLILEPGIMQVVGNMRNIQNATVSGTPENDLVGDFSREERDRYSRIKALYENYSQADAIKKSVIEASVQVIRDSIDKARMGFIAEHPGAMTSGVYLYVLQNRLSLPELEKRYNSLDPAIRNNSYGNIVAEKIAALKRTAIGNRAPAFEMQDMQGNSVSLADFRGRYILLDFWASWCVPCRKEMPAVRAAWQKFKDKGFTVIAVSLDNNKQKWLDAVKEEDLRWTNTRENLGAPDGIAQLYGVGPIPDNFLIDPTGKIIGRELRGKELEARLMQEFKK